MVCCGNIPPGPGQQALIDELSYQASILPGFHPSAGILLENGDEFLVQVQIYLAKRFRAEIRI